MKVDPAHFIYFSWKEIDTFFRGEYMLFDCHLAGVSHARVILRKIKVKLCIPIVSLK